MAPRVDIFADAPPLTAGRIKSAIARLMMLWPWSIRYTAKTEKDRATDAQGRRYGDYRWLSVSFGHLHLNIMPRHVRGWQSSIFWRDGETPNEYARRIENTDWVRRMKKIELG